MSKELEALEFICKILKEKGIDIKWLFKEQYNTIKQRLESIDNAKPSEAFECLRQIGIIEMYYHDGTLLKDSISFKPEYDTIKNYIIKAQEDEEENERLWNDITTVDKQYTDLMLDYQEQKKVLEIIKELISKNCKIELIDGGTYYQIRIKVMGSGYTFGMSITKQEFDLLKKWMGKDKSE